jgi:hypothetical protein
LPGAFGVVLGDFLCAEPVPPCSALELRFRLDDVIITEGEVQEQTVVRHEEICWAGMHSRLQSVIAVLALDMREKTSLHREFSRADLLPSPHRMP